MNRLLTFFMAVIMSTAFFACEEDDSSTGGGLNTPTPSGAIAMSAKIDGATWTAFEGQIAAELDSTGTLLIIASGAAGTDTSLIALSTEAPQGGPFTIDTTSNSDNSASLNLFFIGVSGTIAITAHNANTNVVSGTFNFVTGEFFGEPGSTVTEGVFNNVIYTE